MKKKLNLKKETVAMLDGMNDVRGGGGTVAVSFQSNCNLCPTQNNTCWCTRTPACDDPKPVSLGQPACVVSNMPESCPCVASKGLESCGCIRPTILGC